MWHFFQQHGQGLPACAAHSSPTWSNDRPTHTKTLTYVKHYEFTTLPISSGSFQLCLCKFILLTHNLMRKVIMWPMHVKGLFSSSWSLPPWVMWLYKQTALMAVIMAIIYNLILNCDFSYCEIRNNARQILNKSHKYLVTYLLIYLFIFSFISLIYFIYLFICFLRSAQDEVTSNFCCLALNQLNNIFRWGSLAKQLLFVLREERVYSRGAWIVGPLPSQCELARVSDQKRTIWRTTTGRFFIWRCSFLIKHLKTYAFYYGNIIRLKLMVKRVRVRFTCCHRQWNNQFDLTARHVSITLFSRLSRWTAHSSLTL